MLRSFSTSGGKRRRLLGSKTIDCSHLIAKVTLKEFRSGAGSPRGLVEQQERQVKRAKSPDDIVLREKSRNGKELGDPRYYEPTNTPRYLDKSTLNINFVKWQRYRAKGEDNKIEG
ncbi:hypothetical protein BHYA_0096g00230 [Botrytis hyacinthi]|uniref:Uncharacterized protein n=1 Tax=Botrytis hyacinthi TaxID=278943 RepID=A0A4Z1GKL5_9HELO|nr:hypothetical protein BHYA_0096g00230 [Botrytis hyacinthi]